MNSSVFLSPFTTNWTFIARKRRKNHLCTSYQDDQEIHPSVYLKVSGLNSRGGRLRGVLVELVVPEVVTAER